MQVSARPVSRFRGLLLTSIAGSALVSSGTQVAAQQVPLETVTITAEINLNTAAGVAPTLTPLDAIQPTSIIDQDFIEKNEPLSANYDEIIKHTPSEFQNRDTSEHPGILVMRMLIVLFLAGAAPDPARKPPQDCFSPQQLDGWRAAYGKTLYVRVDINRYYRNDLARECSVLASPDAQLILNVQGGSTICSAANVQLKATEPFVTIPEPCFVKDMTELSAAEATAIPPSQRP